MELVGFVCFYLVSLCVWELNCAIKIIVCFKIAQYCRQYTADSYWRVLLLLLLSVTASLCIPFCWHVTLLCSLSVSQCSFETSGSTQQSDSGSDPKIRVSSITQHWKPPDTSLLRLQIRCYLLINYASNLLCVIVAQWE